VTELILASRSASRGAVLRGAGIAFKAMESGVDEAAVKAELARIGADPRQVAVQLAERKALAVSAHRPGLVIGADQTLELDGALYDKAGTVHEARARLSQLRGRTHLLHAAVAVASGGDVLWRTVESPRMIMRAFSDGFLDAYVAAAGDALTASVGCYYLEGLGAQLFERIEGDYFAILGLPLLPLLEFLRGRGTLAA